MYMTIETACDDQYGFATVAASGSTDEIGGHLLVTGAGYDYSYAEGGVLSLTFDPAGNPLLYGLLQLD
jgi:hypothetical protein